MKVTEKNKSKMKVGSVRYCRTSSDCPAIWAMTIFLTLNDFILPYRNASASSLSLHTTNSCVYEKKSTVTVNGPPKNDFFMTIQPCLVF